MLTIASPHNPRLKEAARLLDSVHERRKSKRCVIEGEHLIEMYVSRFGAPQTLIATEACAQTPFVRNLATQAGHRVLSVTEALFKDIASLPPAVGMMAVIDIPPPATSYGAFCVLLEEVQDPGNVGTMLRTAAAAGVTHAVLSSHCASAWAPKVLRAAQGAHFLLEIVEDVDAVAWAQQFRGKSNAGNADGNSGCLVGTVVDKGQDLFATALLQPLALAFGNEGSGLSSALTQQLDLRVTIPMPGGMESLNVAAAAAITLFECVRQRR